MSALTGEAPSAILRHGHRDNDGAVREGEIPQTGILQRAAHDRVVASRHARLRNVGHIRLRAQRRVACPDAAALVSKFFLRMASASESARLVESTPPQA